MKRFDPYLTPLEFSEQATIKNVKQGLLKAADIGYPLVIKASEGGGGKGIRVVMRSEEFERAYEQIMDEVPGSPIFLMQLAENVRHLEVQILSGHVWEFSFPLWA